MSEKSPAFVSGETDLHRGPYQTSDNGRKLVPLFGIDDHIVATVQGLKKLPGPIVLKVAADAGTHSKHPGIATLGEDIDGNLWKRLLQSLNGGQEMNGIADAARADEENRLRGKGTRRW